MIKRFLKSSVIFFVILGVTFSNVPFYALSGLIDSYAKTQGVVDKIWLVEQNHSSDVVDKFQSIRSVAEKIKIYNAMAAVANDAASESHTGTTGNASSASFTWNHTPVGTPRGVLVFVYTISAAKKVTSVTYGGVAMTEIAGGAAVDTATEPGRIDTFFLGTGIGTGVKSVVVNRTNDVTVMYASAVTVTAGADTEIYLPGIVLLQNNGTFAVQSVTDGSTGVNSVRYAAGYSGGSAVLPAGAGSTVLNSIDFGALTVTTARETTAGQGARNVGFAYATSDDRAAVHLAVREVVPPVTTITNFVSAEPGNSTIAPNASGMVDSFGLATNSGTDTVTAATVGLAAGMGQYIQTVAITNDGDTVTYCSAAPSGDTASLSSCTIPVTTTNTQFKIKLTAKTHAVMPVPAGGSYAVTATVTGWTGTNTTHAGTDSGSSTLTIDNASPSGATSVSGTAGNAANTINWTTSNSGDFDTTNGSVILRWASGSAGAEVPAEGNSTYTAGNTITTATVACVISSAASTAQSKIDGTGGDAGCTTTALTNGQAYTYKAFQRDTNGNYDVGVLIGTFTPSAPASTLTISASVGSKVANVDSGATSAFVHNTSCTTDGTCSAFKLAAGGGAVVVTSITVTESSASLNADAELSNATLIYDTDANYSNGTTGTFGTDATFTSQAVTFTNAGLNIPNGSTYYFYIRTDFVNGVNNPTGGATVNFQIANTTDVVSDGTESGTATLAGTTTVRPNVTDVTSSPLGDGGRNGETFTITGAGFGAVCGSLSVVVGGLTLTCNSAATTTISATIPSTQITTYGGASSMLVTVGGTADDASQTYYVYPSVNLVSTPLVSNAARELDNITLTNSTANASRFGATQGTVTFSGGFGSVSGSVVSWGDTSIEVTVPAGIDDTIYLGDITVTRNSDSKTDLAYDSNGFRILPKVVSTAPVNAKGGQSQAITVAGDHFCQDANCADYATDSDDMTINAVSGKASYTALSNTSLSVSVPATATDGNLILASDSANGGTTYTSNSFSYDVKFGPSTPTGSSAGGSNNPGLSGTAFSDGTDGDTHLKAQWQIAHNADGDWTTPEWTRTSGSAEVGTTVNTTNGAFANSDVGQTELDCGTTYKGRVRYMDNANGGADAYTWEWSSWSANYTFATAVCNVAPTITVSQPDGTGDTVNAGDPYNITYDLADPDNIVTAAMYYDTNNDLVGGTAIGGPCATAAEGSGVTCSWDTTSVTPGVYWVYGVTNDGVNPEVKDLSAGQITINAPPQVVADSVGTQTANFDSGVTGQYVGAAWTFRQTTGSADTITALTLSDVGGSVNANIDLSNAFLRYEQPGASTCTYNGTETSTGTVGFNASDQAVFSGLTIPVTLHATNVTCVYLIFDFKNGTAYPAGGQTFEPEITSSANFTLQNSTAKAGTYPVTLSGTTTVRPNVTDATDSALGDGGRNGETFTITGTGFGSSCASISVVVGGLTLTCNSAATTTISATIPATQTTTYGGASSMLVTVGGTADDASQTYYVYPSVNLVSTPLVSNAAREGETITLTNSTANASRFGATEGTVTFSGGYGSVVAPGADVTWGDTSIDVIVPAAIGDNVYLGDITVTRNSDSKTDTAYGSDGFRVLPRITSNTPNSGIIADRIKITGDHFCQGAGCPVSPNRSGANDNVKFGSTQALDGDFVNSGAAPCSGNAQAWIDTEICVKVPAGTPVGAQATIVRSNAYNSDTMAFTVSSVVPTDPTNLIQKDANIVTITTGETASSTPIRYTFDTSSGISGGTMYAQVEVRPVLGANKDFTSTCSANPYCFEGLGTAYGGGTINLLATSTPVDDIYHWQARVCYNKNGTHTTACDGTGDNPSALWVSYGGNAETATDFKIDATAPVISNPSSSGPPAPGTNTATITWTTDEPSTSQVQYQAMAVGSCPSFSFASSCSTNNDCTALNASLVYSPHTTSLSNLNSGTAYCYRVRSKDAIGNEKIDTNNYSFTTQTISTPAKSTNTFIDGATGTISSATTYYFKVDAPETTPSVKSAYVEVVGVVSGGTGTVTVAVNGSSRAYDVSATNPTLYRFMYPIASPNTETNLNLNDVAPCSNAVVPGTPPKCNKVVLTPATVSVNVLSAKIITTYSYTP